MVWNDRTKLGTVIVVSVIAGLFFFWIAVLLLAVGAFLIVWGNDPKRTEEFLAGLPGGPQLLKALSQVEFGDPLARALIARGIALRNSRLTAPVSEEASAVVD